jgi:hypothetical protein
MSAIPRISGKIHSAKQIHFFPGNIFGAPPGIEPTTLRPLLIDIQKVWHLLSKFHSCNCCDSWATVRVEKYGPRASANIGRVLLMLNWKFGHGSARWLITKVNNQCIWAAWLGHLCVVLMLSNAVLFLVILCRARLLVRSAPTFHTAGLNNFSSV